MTNNTIVLDCETTGLPEPEIVDLNQQPYITEIYCAKLDENLEQIDEFETFVKPTYNGNTIPIPEHITKITGIDDSMVSDAPEFIQIYKPLAEFFQGVDTIVAHNLPFDINMLINELGRHDLEFKFPWPMNWVCTVEASHPIYNKRMKLGALYQHCTGNFLQGAHRAKNDALPLIEIYRWLIKEGFVSKDVSE